MYTTHLGAASSESDYVEIVLAASFPRTRTSYFCNLRKVHLCGIILEHSYFFSFMTYKKCKLLRTFSQLLVQEEWTHFWCSVDT